MKTIIKTIGTEITSVLSRVEEAEALQVSNELKKAKRIFVYGEGRSGLMGKAFAMRLMHGGYSVYVLGETITPSIGREDLLVLISGSGSTGRIHELAVKAQEIGAKVVLVSASRESKIASVSDVLLVIPAATKHRGAFGPDTIQPLGNQFDQSVHLVLDGIIIHSLQENEKRNLEMENRHANLE
ncbi:6-phospho-3-hexuloisomerase [Bacillus sp. V3-13]|uniref:6-phospho-3-hexuloisomerase n=1 Tax=Bacillus sp. V3-13 TaxID=2053728 RepID=UPI000C76C7AF|nr:6-phospho-3-hexuloisomerase [Bacillus sp. V3-13]PLR76771.1 6-phospho-3-hexuloisomerase [Bacillus sp. V3-13]